MFDVYELHITKEMRPDCFGPYVEEAYIMERNKDPEILLKRMKEICNAFIDEVIADYGITISVYKDSDMLCITAQNKVYEEDDEDYIEKHLMVNFYAMLQ